MNIDKESSSIQDARGHGTSSSHVEVGLDQIKHFDEDEQELLIIDKQGFIKEEDRPKFKIWFNLIIAICTALFLLLFKIYGIPTLSVPCILDRGHAFLEPLNRMCNDNPSFGHGVIILSSLSIDIIVISSLAYWFINCRSARLPMAILGFYIVRIPHIYMYTPKFPDGFFFEYPGFPSASVPYGRQSDFYFSGHTGIMTLMFLEWRTLGFKKMQYLNGFLLVYVMFSLLVIRVHYTIDVTAGLMFAHYVYILCQHYENKVNVKLRKVQLWIALTAKKVFKKK